MNTTTSLILTECGCPPGNWNARNNRNGISTYHDNPILAGLAALIATFGDDAWNLAIHAIERCNWGPEYTVETSLTETFDPPASTLSNVEVIVP